MIEKIFNPKTVAVIGATEQEESVGKGLMENLDSEKRQLLPVNPNREEVLGKKSYDSVTDINKQVDLAVVAVPKQIVLKVIDECIEKQVGGVIVVSAGFAEIGPEGRKRQDKLADRLQKADIPLVGPNSLGVLRPPVDLNASFAPGTPKEGTLALLSQSGALIDSIIDGSYSENYGFSLLVSVGNAADLKLTDYIQLADQDPSTEVITLYIEGVEKGRELINTLEQTKKPVVAIKGGKSQASREAISSHTGSLAGDYKIFSSGLKQAGVIEVNSLQELFDTAKALAWQSNLDGEVAVVTNGGGAGVLLTDYLREEDLKLSTLEDSSIDKLEGNLHPDSSMANPLDIVGDASPDDYELAAKTFLNQDNTAGLIVIQTLQIMTKPLENAKRLVRLERDTSKPIATVFMGKGEETSKAISYLEENGIPNYQDPKRAARALGGLRSV